MQVSGARKSAPGTLLGGKGISPGTHCPSAVCLPAGFPVFHLRLLLGSLPSCEGVSTIWNLLSSYPCWPFVWNKTTIVGTQGHHSLLASLKLRSRLRSVSLPCAGPAGWVTPVPSSSLRLSSCTQLMWAHNKSEWQLVWTKGHSAFKWPHLFFMSDPKQQERCHQVGFVSKLKM